MNALMTNSWEQVFSSLLSSHTKSFIFFDERAKSEICKCIVGEWAKYEYFCGVCYVHKRADTQQTYRSHTIIIMYSRTLYIFLCLSSISSSHSTCSERYIRRRLCKNERRKCLLRNCWIVVETHSNKNKSLVRKWN